jgi:hypothetical protein
MGRRRRAVGVSPVTSIDSDESPIRLDRPAAYRLADSPDREAAELLNRVDIESMPEIGHAYGVDARGVIGESEVEFATRLRA